MRTRTGLVQNAPFCEKHWCYVENPEECVDASSGNPTAHLSFYDTAGSELPILGWFDSFDNYTYTDVWRQRAFADPLFYSYDACDDVDLYTTPLQIEQELSYPRTYEFSLYHVETYRRIKNKYERVMDIPKRCVMPDGRFYPWDDNGVLNYITNMKFVHNLTNRMYFTISSDQYDRSMAIRPTLTQLRDGEDGFYPSFCQSPAVRYGEFGQTSRLPQMCYMFGSSYTFWSAGLFQAITGPSSILGAVSTSAFMTFNLCGDTNRLDGVFERYSPTRLGSLMLSSFENWKRRAFVNETQTAALRSPIRFINVSHVDDCASSCQGRLSCKEWLLYDDGSEWIRLGDRLRVLVRDDDEMEVFDIQSGKRLLSHKSGSGFSQFKGFDVSTPNEISTIARALNGSSVVKVAELSQYPTLVKPSGIPLVDAITKYKYLLITESDPPVYVMHFVRKSQAYRRQRCYLLSDAARIELASQSSPQQYAPTDISFEGGTMLMDAPPVLPARTPLRTAAVKFLDPSTKVGQWLRDVVFPNTDHFDYKARRDAQTNELPVMMLSEKERTRVDSPESVVPSATARDVLRLVLQMRSGETEQVRTVIPNVVNYRDLSIRDCAKSFVKDGIDTCPTVQAVAFDPFPNNKHVHPWDKVGIESLPTKSTAESVLRSSCGEKASAIFLSNTTDVYIVFKDTEFAEWRDTLDNFKPKSDEYCTTPYIRGKVHCGALRIAVLVASQLLVSSNLENPDVCTILMQGKRCDIRPKWHFGGFSVGAAASPLLVAFLDALLERHYGLDFSREDVTVDMWGMHNFADKTFVDWFTSRWGASTNIYTDRFDNVGNIVNLYGFGGFTKTQSFGDIQGHVSTPIGGCGIVTHKKLKECYDTCDFENLEVERCFRWLTSAMVSPPQAHELVSQLMIKQDEIPSFSQKTSDRLNFFVAGIDFLDNVLKYYTTDTIGCLEDFARHVDTRELCYDEIHGDPWTFNPFLHISRDKAGQRSSWCLTERARLKARAGDLAGWDALCCNLDTQAEVSELRTADDGAKPSFTGYESILTPPPPAPPLHPPLPPSSPPLPDTPPTPPTAPPVPHTPPVNPPPPSSPPKPSSPPSLPPSPYSPPFPPWPPQLPNSILVAGPSYVLPPTHWVPKKGDELLVDHHAITIVSDHEVRFQQLQGSTMRSYASYKVRRLTSSELVISPSNRDSLVYTYSVVAGKLTGIQGSLGPHPGLCTHTPCPMKSYSFSPPAPPASPCSPLSMTLTDSWGDGWNGNRLQVRYFYNGTSVSDGVAWKTREVTVSSSYTRVFVDCLEPVIECIRIDYEKPSVESWPDETSWSATYEGQTTSAAHAVDGAKTLYLPLACDPLFGVVTSTVVDFAGGFRITSGGAQYVKDFGKKEGLSADDEAAFAVAFGTTYSGGDYVTDAHMSLVDSSAYLFSQWFDVFTPPLYRITSGGAQYVKDFGKREGLSADDQAAFAVAFGTTYSGGDFVTDAPHVAREL